MIINILIFLVSAIVGSFVHLCLTLDISIGFYVEPIIESLYYVRMYWWVSVLYGMLGFSIYNLIKIIQLIKNIKGLL